MGRFFVTQCISFSLLVLNYFLLFYQPLQCSRHSSLAGVCVYSCVRIVTSELSDISPTYVAWPVVHVYLIEFEEKNKDY